MLLNVYILGVVMQSGDSVTHTVPVYEGYALRDATLRYDVGGRYMTDYLMKILAERGYSFTTSAEREIVRDIKEKMCFVAENYGDELKKNDTSADTRDKYYELPDGQVITIGNELFRALETFFQPWLLGKSMSGISSLLYDSIMKCDVDLREDMYGNIILSGGVCCLPGMDKRVLKEMIALAPTSVKVKIGNQANDKDSRDRRQYLSWIGGSLMASQSSFGGLLITPEQYMEYGPGIVHRKCF